MEQKQAKVQRPGYRFDSRNNTRAGSWYKSSQSTNKVQDTTPHEKEIKMFYKPTLPKEAPPYESSWHLLTTAKLRQFSKSPNVTTTFNDSRDIVSLTVTEHDGIYHSTYRRLKHKRNSAYQTEVWECILAKFMNHKKVTKKYWSITRDEQLYAVIDAEMTQKKKSRST
jgi:hypothetical protein